MELKRDTRTNLDLSSEVEVLNYVYAALPPIEVVARATLGDATKPLAGAGGTYTLNFYLNSVFIAPSSRVPVEPGRTRAVVVSRTIPLESGDVVSVRVKGAGGDNSVNTTATLRDVTSIKLSEVEGLGTVSVDYNYGGPDNLSYQTAAGYAVADADVLAFLKADWDVGNRHPTYAVASSRTIEDHGRWARPMLLNPGDYVLRYSKTGQFGPDLRELTVS